MDFKAIAARRSAISSRRAWMSPSLSESCSCAWRALSMVSTRLPPAEGGSSDANESTLRLAST